MHLPVLVYKYLGRLHKDTCLGRRWRNIVLELGGKLQTKKQRHLAGTEKPNPDYEFLVWGWNLNQGQQSWKTEHFDSINFWFYSYKPKLVSTAYFPEFCEQNHMHISQEGFKLEKVLSIQCWHTSVCMGLNKMNMLYPRCKFNIYWILILR